MTEGLGERLCASGSKSDVAVYRKKPDARARKIASHFGEGKNPRASSAPITGAIASIPRNTKSVRLAFSPRVNQHHRVEPVAHVVRYDRNRHRRGRIRDLCGARRTLFGNATVADTLRAEAKSAIQSLKAMGLKTILLTADAQAVAQEVGKKLGVDEIASDLLPEDKLQYVKQLVAKGHKVVMVGDGVNDAPALMQASVGIAMGSGTDVARESADVVLIGSDLSKLVETLRTARRCRSTIMQNFVGTRVVDSIGVGLAAFGFLNPLLAAFIHVSSEMAFILNSARLLPPVSAANQFVRGILSQSPSAAN